MILKPSGLSLVSFFLGLTIGLVVAAYIAFYVTKTPVPFVDRLNDTNLIDPAEINTSKENVDNVVIKVLPEKEVVFPQDEIEFLINDRKQAEDDKSSYKSTKEDLRVPERYTRLIEPTPQTKRIKKLEKKTINVFYLQVGAFRSIDEADRMRARLAFLGFEASLYKKNKPGSVFYRVRLGPFTSKEELNIVKKRLSGDNIKSHVVSGEKN
jgi:cell division protein FtsN